MSSPKTFAKHAASESGFRWEAPREKALERFLFPSEV
jgi:hypothetical protein